jgi:hypothetical protein
MMLGKSQCLYVFICLYGGIIIVLFIRAFFRRRLLKDYEDLKGVDFTAGITNRFLKPLHVVSRQVQALGLLRKSIAEASDQVQQRYKHFRMLTLIAYILLVLLIIFSFVAHKVC